MPLIGFAGGPFTLLCYLVCGRPSKEFGAARSFLYAQPASGASGCSISLADAMAVYLARAGRGRRAGAACCSSPGPACSRRVNSTGSRCARVRRTVARCASSACRSSTTSTRARRSCESVADLEVDVIGVDWRSPLSTVRRILGPGKAVQGNLDPAALFAAAGGAAPTRRHRAR